MIKDIFSLFSFIFKLLFKGIKYAFKGVGWYMKNVLDLFSYRSEKTIKKVSVKEEIL